MHGRFLFILSFFILDNVTEVELAVTPFYSNALLSHDRGDELGGRDVKTRVVDPVQSFGSDHDRSLRLVALAIQRRRIKCPAYNTRF